MINIDNKYCLELHEKVKQKMKWNPIKIYFCVKTVSTKFNTLFCAARVTNFIPKVTFVLFQTFNNTNWCFNVNRTEV